MLALISMEILLNSVFAGFVVGCITGVIIMVLVEAWLFIMDFISARDLDKLDKLEDPVEFNIFRGKRHRRDDRILKISLICLILTGPGIIVGGGFLFSFPLFWFVYIITSIICCVVVAGVIALFFASLS